MVSRTPRLYMPTPLLRDNLPRIWVSEWLQKALRETSGYLLQNCQEVCQEAILIPCKLLNLAIYDGFGAEEGNLFRTP
jgi:hypothetical protein